MNPDKFRNTNAFMDPAKFERAVGKSSVTNFELQINGGVPGLCETLKTHERAHPSRRPHAAAIKVMGQLGIGDETFPARILEHVGLRSKMSSILTVQPDGGGDRREEVALALQRQGLRPSESNLAQGVICRVTQAVLGQIETGNTIGDKAPLQGGQIDAALQQGAHCASHCSRAMSASAAWTCSVERTPSQCGVQQTSSFIMGFSMLHAKRK